MGVRGLRGGKRWVELASEEKPEQEGQAGMKLVFEPRV